MDSDDLISFSQLKVKNNDEYFFKIGANIIAMKGQEKKSSLEFNDKYKLVFQLSHSGDFMIVFNGECF